MKKSELKCKHCGNTEEFYTKDTWQGPVPSYFRPDGKESERNTDMYNLLRCTHFSKFIYCAECESRVCRVEDLEE